VGIAAAEWQVNSGGTVVSASVSNGGVLDVLSGGVVSQVLVSSGGEVSGGGLVEGFNNSVFGGVVTDVTLYDADLYLVSGGTADGLLVGDGSTFFVAPHATASHEVLSGSGSYEAILDDSGSVVSAVAESRGVVEVEAGASATGTIVESGGYDINFGSDTSAVVQAGGSAVTFGALFSGTTVLSGGYIVASGNYSPASVFSNVVVSSGGTAVLQDEFELHSGATSLGVQLANNAIEFQNITFESGATLNFGDFIFYSGANIALNTDLHLINGVLIVSSGASLYGDNTDGYAVGDQGFASAIDVSSGQYFGVYSGGSASVDTVEAGGRLAVNTGGFATGNVLESGGSAYIWSGTISNTTVSSGGMLTIDNQGLAEATLILPGAQIMLLAGGAMSGLTIASGAQFAAQAGETGIVVQSGGTVIPGGGATGVVLSGGTLLVSAVTAGATAGDSLAPVQVPETVAGFTISVGGDALASGGVTVSSGGTLQLAPGGQVTSAHVLSGGTLELESGASLPAYTMEYGATLVLDAGAVVSSVGDTQGETIIGPGVMIGSTTVYGAVSGVTLGEAGQFGQLTVWGGTSSSTAITVVSGSITNNAGRIMGVTLEPTSGGGAPNVFWNDGSASNVIVGAHDTATVELDSWQSNTTVQSGGTLDVAQGVTLAGGVVQSGGAVSGLTLSSGVTVFGPANTGLVDGLTVSSGGMILSLEVASGAVASGFIVASNSTEQIDSGGLALGANVLSSGILNLLDGASATGVVQSGGLLNIADITSGQVFSNQYSGGILTTESTVVVVEGVTVSSGGIVQLSSNPYVLSGGVFVLTSNGQYTDPVVESGGVLLLEAGGMPLAQFQHGAIVEIGSGVVLSGVTFNSNVTLEGPGTINGSDAAAGIVSGVVAGNAAGTCYLELSSGGLGLNIDYVRGLFTVDRGATVSATLLAPTNNTGELYYLSGIGETALAEIFGVADGTIVDRFAIQAVESGGFASGTIVNSGGLESIVSGGSASGTVVYSGGAESLRSGGQAAGVTVSSGGAGYFEVVVSAGQTFFAGPVSATTTISGVTLLSGAEDDVTNATVLSGGTLNVASGGTAFALTVSSGGHVSGGLLIGSSTDAGVITSETLGEAFESGYVEVMAFGAANTITIANGEIKVDVSAIADDTVVSGAATVVDNYGVTTATTISAGALQYVESGADDYNATIAYGGYEYVDNGGATSGTAVISGGSLYVYSGGLISGVTVFNGGSILTLGGDTVANTVVSSGGAAYFELTVNAGQTYVAGALGAATVVSGVTLRAGADEDFTNVAVSSGGTLSLASTGAAFEVGIGSGGHVSGTGLLLGGVSDAGTISASVVGETLVAGDVDILAGGVANSMKVANGAITVEVGGLANSTSLSAAGDELEVLGSASGTTVGSGAFVVVDSRGIDIGTTIASGGYEFVENGGTASGTVIASGGELEVQYLGSLASIDPLVGANVLFDRVSGSVAEVVGNKLEVISAGAVVASATLSPGFGSEQFQTTLSSSGTLLTAVAPATPTLAGSTAAVTYVSLAPAVSVAPSITVSDTNYNAIVSATVSITGGLRAGDQLKIAPLAGVVESYNAVTGQLTLTGIASLAQYQAALASVSFASTSVDATGDGTDTARTIAFTVNNGVASNTVSATINVSAQSAATLTAVDGAPASVSYASLTGLLASGATGLLVQSATLAAGSAGAGIFSLDTAHQVLDFTPAAGFAGTATATVTVKDQNNVLYGVTLPIDVVVRATPTSVASPSGTIIQTGASSTTTSTYSPSGALISTEAAYTNGVTLFTDGSGTRYAATITSALNGGGSEIQNFDGTWDQQSASITWPEGGGLTIEQSFNAAWGQTSATATTVNGNVTIIQTFDANWNQRSAERIDVEAGYTQTQYFDANWNQTSASLSFNLGGGAVKTQYFDANWNQTSATLTTHPSAGQTEIQTFNAAWVQTSAQIITTGGGQTTTQYFDANWNQLRVTDDLTLTSGAFTDRFLSFDGSWNLLSEVDTQTNGAQDYVTYAQAGGGQTLAASTGHSTTFVFTPGTLNGDTLSGLNTLSLGGSQHDVLDFEGYGANAALTQINATTWQVSAQGDAKETFQVTGGGTLGDGDYQFIAAGSAITVLGADASAVASGSSSGGAAPSPASGIIAAGGAGQTLALAQNETVYGAAAGGDLFQGASASLTGDTLVNFGRSGDSLDVTDMAFTGVGPAFVESAGAAFGVLTVSDGVHTASVILFGQFAASGFSASSDGGAGQVITYAPAITTPAIAPPQ
jgi:autotransporter passenger strand-loop-strand repeat protein